MFRGFLKKTISAALVFIILTIFFGCRENATNSTSQAIKTYSSKAEQQSNDYNSKTQDYKSKTVYITPTGKRYHYSSTCGGKNSKQADLEDAINIYLLTPCKKCVR